MAKTKKPKTVGKKISDFLFSVVAIAIVVVCVVLLMGKIRNKPAFIGNKAAVWILTDSMSDEIPENTYILVEKVSAKDIRVGDVITFTSDDPSLGGSLNTHRVVEIIGDNEEFITKGDHNLIEDKTTAKADNVWGRYVKKLPALTVMMRFFLTPKGLIVTLVILGLITLAMFIPDIVKGAREDRLKSEEEKRAETERLIAEEVATLERENAGRNESEESENSPKD